MKLITLDTIGSTNTYCKENIDILDDKTVIQALHQTSGRGRLSRKWLDFGIGNAFLTFVLKPSNSFDEKYSNLTQYLSVILAKLLESYGVQTQIKWPNDVLINNKKVAGILAETVMQGNNFKGLALGIGVNLNATAVEVANVEDRIVTSLNLELNGKVDLNLFVEQLIDAFFENYDRFLSQGFEFIKGDYLSRLAYIDKEISVDILGKHKNGKIITVNNKGELVLDKNGKEFTLTIGDIL